MVPWDLGCRTLGVPHPQLRCGVRACSTEAEARAAAWCGRLQGRIQARAPRGQHSLLTTRQLRPGRKQPLAHEHPNVSTPA